MSSSTRSSGSQGLTRALLSIRPPYARAIFEGRKRFEFRKSIFRHAVDTIEVYVTSPVGQVVGEFEVMAVIKAPISELWRHTRELAGIDKRTFLDYFSGRQDGYAIAIGRVTQYEQPYCPIKTHGVKPPQSFAYIQTRNVEARTGAA